MGKHFVFVYFLYPLLVPFAWYAALPPNYINSWNDLESKFHEHFFFGEYELGLADLALVRH
jgi:hypothetical protein